MIRTIIVRDYDEMSRRAAMMIGSVVTLNPKAVLGLATGTTPIGCYDILADACSRGELDFSGVHSANLDEYLGLEPSHDQSYRYFMNKYLFEKINIKKENTFVPNGMAADPENEGHAYDELLARLGYADIQLLGIGQNGHIGFNEPGDSFILPTHPVDLTWSTIKANARLFDKEEDVPRRAITMGIEGIMRAKTVLLLANGEAKAQAVHDTVQGPVTPYVPASILQLHPHAIVICDEAAGSMLEM